MRFSQLLQRGDSAFERGVGKVLATRARELGDCSFGALKPQCQGFAARTQARA